MGKTSTHLRALSKDGWSDAKIAQAVRTLLTRAVIREIGIPMEEYESCYGFSTQPSSQSVYRWRTSKSSPTLLAIVAIIDHLYETIQPQ